jgi:hypothetical protein
MSTRWLQIWYVGRCPPTIEGAERWSRLGGGGTGGPVSDEMR